MAAIAGSIFSLLFRFPFGNEDGEKLVSNLKPNIVLILSGKRKCGKDFLAEKLLEQ